MSDTKTPVPPTTDPLAPSDVKELDTTQTVNIESELSKVATTFKTADLTNPTPPPTKSQTDPMAIDPEANPQMANLIAMAEERNTPTLVKRELKIVQTIQSNSAKVMQILKDHGMDSQQAAHAHKRLMELE